MSNFCENFKFTPHPGIPFRDVDVLDRVRLTSEKDYLALNETRPNWNVKIVDEDWLNWVMVTDMFKRIKDSDDKDEKCVMLLPNPEAYYKHVAYLINTFRVSCRNLVIFTMDEWADQDGNIAPLNYHAGFGNAFFRFFYEEIDPELRPKLENIHYPTNENIAVYSKMLQDEGEADITYSGCGWSGHSAFVDAVPQFGFINGEEPPLEEWLQMGARVADLHLMTLAQNSLHASFGMCGDVAFTPPRCATVGPRDIVNCKKIFELHNFTIGPTDISWQKLMSRLVCFGPVTPRVPDSVVQLAPDVDFYVTELIASPIQYDSDRQYR